MILLCLLGCTKDTEEESVAVYDVPDEYQVVVDRFLEEATIRGIDLRIHNLIIRNDPQLAFDACGDCNSLDPNATSQKIIRLNPRGCWQNDLQLEALIFHELGHCILGREHTNELLPNGDPKSIMTPGKIDLYSPCVYQFGDENPCNYTFKRDYYLDELFNPDTQVPDWAK
jgi:hypothetical protein